MTLVLTLRRLLTRDSAIKWRVAGGFFWVLVGSVSLQLSGLLKAVIPARLLGIEGYGKLVAVLSILGMFAGFGGLGLGATATRYTAALRNTNPKQAGQILWLCSRAAIVTSTLVVAALLGGAGPIALHFLGNPALAAPMRLGAIYVLFVSLNAFQAGALAGLEAFSRVARVSFVQACLEVILMLALTRAWGISGAVLALGAGAFAAWVMQGVVIRGECRRYGIVPQASWGGPHKEALVRFALPAALSGVLGGTVLAAVNGILLSTPGGAGELAILGAAMAVRNVALFAPALLARVSLPVLTNLHSEGDRRGYGRTLTLSVAFAAGTSGAIGIILACSGRGVLSLFGKSFQIGVGVLTVVMCSAVAEVVATMLFQVLYSHGRIWAHLSVVAIWSLFLLAGSAVLAPRFGAAGVAMALLIAWVWSMVCYATLARRTLAGGAGVARES